MIIHYNNLLDRADCGMSSAMEHTRYPLSNLLDDKLCKFTKLKAGTASINFTFGESVTADSFGVAGYNDTSFLLEASNSATFDTLLLSKTITANIINGVYHPTTVYFDQVSARYWRVTFTGSNVHRIGKIYLGQCYKFVGMEAKQQSIDLNINDTTTVNDTGQVYTQSNYIHQTCKIQTTSITHEQRLEIDMFVRSVGKHKAVFVLIWNKIQGFIPALYGIIDQDKVTYSRSDSTNKPFKTELSFREIF